MESMCYSGASCNIDGVLWRGTCVSSTQLKSPVWKKRVYLDLEKPKLEEVFLSKPCSVLTGKQ
jgi:hypothetical protein